MFHVEHKADILVIGGGHAGCEAALIAAKMGCDVILLTMRSDRIAEMSCNPSIGGVGKGQLVRELDALGGEMGKNADYTGIQFKRLNTRKGSAVQSSRCQSDKILYAKRMGETVRSTPKITVVEAEAKSLIIEAKKVAGLRCFNANQGFFEIEARQVVITAGTFMKAVMHCGSSESDGGRFGEQSSNGLSESLRESGLKILRLKTGTPARLIRNSIDFSLLQEQRGDDPPKRFSFSQTSIPLPQVSCFLGYTSSETHNVIRKNLSLSPLYSGKITGIGPRYCPSIEDKVVKFPDKGAHHIFFEPEALSSDWIYPNGISTSLPAEVQEQFIRTLAGCSDVVVARFGYAVEYDCIDPTQLSHTLESKNIEGLFLAGQVNGTSGYEEAAAQGLFAGINAALKSQGLPGFVLDRSEAYIGVMVDDLVTMGITEPYRMFTSRSEYRLSIREDNADIRLRSHAIRLGTIGDDDRLRFENKKEELERLRVYISKTWLKPSGEIDSKTKLLRLSDFREPQTIQVLLRRPEYSLNEVENLWGISISENLDLRETVEIETKYEGYINIQKTEIERLGRLTHSRIPDQIDYGKIQGLSREMTEKLSRLRPRSMADAARIPGATPAALTAILAHLKKDPLTQAHVKV